MIWADYGQTGDFSKRKAYKDINSARKLAIPWCKRHKGEFVNFYRSRKSYKPFGSMTWDHWFKNVVYFKMWGVDDRYEASGVSEGGYDVRPDGRLE